MSDLAHRKTDEKLEEMEKRLSAIYSRAEKEIQKTADEYFSKFAKQDEAKRKLLDQGKITEDEYKKWRKGKVMYSNRFTEMKEQCAKQLLNVNQTALAYVNGELPEVYAINYNAIAGSVDGVGGYSFTLVDADTVRNLAVTDTSLLPYKEIDPAKDIPWNMKKINAETLQGVLQGESMDKIAKRLQNVQEMNKTQAIRSARTLVTGAENKGRLDSHKRAEEDGIILEEKWVATKDGRTRHSHAMLNGETKKTNETFSNGLEYPGDPNGRPEEVYNCFAGETKVASDSYVVRSYKHKYDGKIISIKTAGGVQFSCTPNHPILTPNGWVAAELLNNGDNILVTFGEQNVFGGVNPDIKHRFPRIDAIHNLFNVSGGERAVGVSVDFHGDVATSNVEIVTQERLLWNVGDSSRRNGIDKFLLKLSNKTLSCFGSLFEHFWSICKTSFGFIGCKCKSLPFFKCSVSHSCEHGFGTIASRDSVLTEYSINDLPADTVIDGELLDRLSCKVFLDTIINVDVSVLSTHVYNLQTENGYYFVNSIIPQDTEKSNGIFAIAKNCRCTLVAKVNGFKKAQVQKAMAEKQVETPQGFAPASSTKELNQRLSTATGTSADFSAMDLKLANEYLEGFESFYDEYPALRGFVGRVDTKVPKGLTGAYDRKTTYTRDYRHSVSNSVSLTSQYSEGDFHRILDDSIKKGFHFEGMTPQGLARHECTHALDDLIGNTRKGYVKNGKFVSLDGTISANAYNQSVASEILDAVRSERYDEWLTGYFDDVRYLGDYAMTSDKEMLAQCIAYETSGRTHPFSAAVKKRFDELYKEVLG